MFNSNGKASPYCNSTLVKEVSVERVGGHFEVYLNGEFWFSADTMSEVREEFEQNPALH